MKILIKITKNKNQEGTNMKFQVIYLLFLLFLFAVIPKLYSQEIDSSDITIIDSIDFRENLLDSNAAYKQLFDSLSSEGEWVGVKKSELIKEAANDTDDESICDEEDTKIIYVWIPGCATIDWNPYSNGRWVFTYAGWIWISYYSWGWAPYHYGRWFYSYIYGWIWLPGRYWAPNWVIWRHWGPYVGWYPYPPRFRWKNKHRRYVHNHTFPSKPKNWRFVEKKDIEQPVSNKTVLKGNQNFELLTKSEKIKEVNLFKDDDKEIRYFGPNANTISTETGVTIEPKKIKSSNEFPNTREEKNQVKYNKKEENYNPPEEKNYSPPKEKKESPPKEKKYSPPEEKNYSPPKENKESPPKEKNYSPPEEKKSPRSNQSGDYNRSGRTESPGTHERTGEHRSSEGNKSRNPR